MHFQKKFVWRAKTAKNTTLVDHPSQRSATSWSAIGAWSSTTKTRIRVEAVRELRRHSDFDAAGASKDCTAYQKSAQKSGQDPALYSQQSHIAFETQIGVHLK
jgi:hypothetical protein